MQDADIQKQLALQSARRERVMKMSWETGIGQETAHDYRPLVERLGYSPGEIDKSRHVVSRV